MFAIEDSLHAERFGEYYSYEEALDELKRLSKIKWDQEPNLAPCQSWKTCGRMFDILEYDIFSKKHKLLKTTSMLEVDASGVNWKIPIP